jgi:glutaredoxin 3
VAVAAAAVKVKVKVTVTVAMVTSMSAHVSSPVVLYSTPDCAYCEAVKKLLDRLNVSYTIRDVSEDLKAVKELILKTGQVGVPVVEANGKIIVGYHPREIAAILGFNGANTNEKT